MSRTEHTLMQARFSSRKWFAGALIALACLQLVLMLAFGSAKAGFFIDEYFTHTLSNSPYGLNLLIEDNAWNDPGQLLRQFVVIPNHPDSAFNYAHVTVKNAADVHPPLYYYLFHTVSSLAPGIFSKWLGILVNVPFALGSLALVALLTWQLTRSRAYVLLASAVYACNPGVLSNALLLRMYCMLSFFVLLAIWLHALMLTKSLSFGKFLPCVAATYFCGFMTQYYFIIPAGLLSGVCFFYWLFSKQGKQALLYAGSLLAALGATYLFYPAWVDHIFKGYRGVGAVDNLARGDTLFKLKMFTGELNAVLFSYCLPLLGLGVLAVAAVCAWQRRACGVKGLLRACTRTQARRLALILGGLCAVSFFILAKISNVTERNFSVRYFFLLFAPVLLLFAVGAAWLLCRAGVRRTAAVLCVGLIFVCANAFGLANGNSVEYLFQWDTQLLANARDNHDTPVILMHKSTLHMSIANQLMTYDQFFPVLQPDPQPLPDDERFKKATRVLLYLEKKDDPLLKNNEAPIEDFMPYLRENLPQLTNIRKLPSPIYFYQLFELTA